LREFLASVDLWLGSVEPNGIVVVLMLMRKRKKKKRWLLFIVGFKQMICW